MSFDVRFKTPCNIILAGPTQVSLKLVKIHDTVLHNQIFMFSQGNQHLLRNC